MSDERAWGIFRELTHSPGRETDDALILRRVAGCLEEAGFSVALKTTEEIAGGAEEPPLNLFVMCERLEIVATLDRWDLSGCWVKRGDVHNLQPGDVVRAGDSEGALGALRDLARRGVSRALLQEHVDGHLVEFCGVAGPAENASGGWFEWFSHRDQRLRRHAFDPGALAETASRAAAALGLEVWGGDAIVGPTGPPLSST